MPISSNFADLQPLNTTLLSMPRMSSSVDLNRFPTFKQKTLTRQLAEQRLNTLETIQKALKKERKTLKAGKSKELEKLAKVLLNEEVQLSMRITRLGAGQFYTVEFNLDPATIDIHRFIKANCRIDVQIIRNHSFNRAFKTPLY